MTRRDDHPAKGWAASFGRYSMVSLAGNQDSEEIHTRVNHETASRYGLKIKPGYAFYDRDRSGSKENIQLPDLERAIRVVVNREVEALVVPELSRLSRRGMRHIGEMLDAVEDAGGRIIFGKEHLDSGNPGSRAIIAFLAERAREESQALGWRIEQWQETCRLKGKWTGKRPYGFNVVDGGLVKHPEEAPVARRIVDEFLNGATLKEITNILNDAGLPSSGASKAADMLARGRTPKTRLRVSWGKETVRMVLINPALCGWRSHKGRLVLGPDGEPVSFGESIITPAERAQILARMVERTTMVRHSSNPRRIGTRTGGGRPGKYELSGFVRCQTCTLGMVGVTDPIRPSYRAYRCVSPAEGRRCEARAYINGPEAEAEVRGQLFTRLSAMEPGDPILDRIAERWRELTMPESQGERAVLEGRLEAIRARIYDLEEARFMRGQYVTQEDTARWDAMMARLTAQRDALLEARAQLGPPPDFDLAILLDTHLSEKAWEALPVAKRREILKVAVGKVIIGPGKRRQIPASERVRVVLVGEESDF
jgi:DNA invertase Pin-like site-specific DNA recombinase